MCATEARRNRSRNVPLGTISGLLIFLGAATVLFFFEPGAYRFYPRCLFYQTTGLLCPGCGSLRATHQLLHGHIAAALRLNALLVTAIPVGSWVVVRSFLRAKDNSIARLDLRPAWLWAGLAITLLFGLLRNFPFAHAIWFAP